MADELLEEIQKLSRKMDTSKTENEEAFKNYKKELEAKIETIKTDAATQAVTEIKKANDSLKDEVKTLNEDLSKKGAKLEDILEQINDLKAQRGRFQDKGNKHIITANEIIQQKMEKHWKEIQAVGDKDNLKLKFEAEELKAVTNMTSATNLTGNAVAQYDLQPAVRPRRKVHLRDLVPIISSSTGIWKFYRQNIPVGDGSVDWQHTAGNVKSQLDYNLTEVTITVDYLAGFVRFAKQMAADLPFLQTFVANEMIEDYKRTESGQFIPQLAGAAAGSSTTSSTVTVERYIDYISQLMGNDYDPNVILCSAGGWAKVLKTKPDNYSIPGGIEIDANGFVRIVGIPIIVQNNVPAGFSLIGDFSRAAIIQQEGMSVNFYEQDSDNVQRNLMTAKVEARVALATLRLDAFTYAADGTT